MLRTSIDKIGENSLELTKKRSRRYPAKTISDADYADDIAILANTHNQAETLLHSLERATAGIGLHINAHKTEYMCYNQIGDISTLDGTSLKLVDKFTYLGSSVLSTKKDIDSRQTKAWTAIDKLSIIWKSDLTEKMKRSFFQAAVVSILLYGRSSVLTAKRLGKMTVQTMQFWQKAKFSVIYSKYNMLESITIRLSLQSHYFSDMPPAYIYIYIYIYIYRTLQENLWRAHKCCTPMDPHIWPSKSGTTSSNIHTAAMWGCRM